MKDENHRENFEDVTQ
jgi:ATP-binding cassette, subfamily A (ABC1), member 3